MTDLQPLRLERAGAVARIVLSRPEAGNAIDLPMAEAISRAALECDADETIRCVVLTGEGKLFCGGGDVKGFAAAGDAAPALIKAITGNLHLGLARLLRMEKPLVTVVNGPVGGAGFSLACLGDIVIAARSAHFTVGYTAVGLAPDGGLSWLLPRLVGLRRAQELILGNRRVDAEEAAALGLVTRVVDDADLRAEEERVATELAAGPTKAIGAVRRLILSGATSSIETQMELESRTISELAGSAHGREGVAAFAGKRRPDFR